MTDRRRITGRLASMDVDDYYVDGADHTALTVRAVVTGPGWRLEVEKIDARVADFPTPGDEVEVVAGPDGRLSLRAATASAPTATREDG